MKPAQILAWVVLAGVIYGGYTAVHAFKNPWAMSTVSPVLSNLPASAKGCAEKGC